MTLYTRPRVLRMSKIRHCMRRTFHLWLRTDTLPRSPLGYSMSRRGSVNAQQEPIGTIIAHCIVLYLYVYIELLAVHTNQKRFQCERHRERKARVSYYRPRKSERETAVEQRREGRESAFNWVGEWGARRKVVENETSANSTTQYPINKHFTKTSIFFPFVQCHSVVRGSLRLVFHVQTPLLNP